VNRPDTGTSLMIALLAACAACPGALAAHDDGDFQYWSTAKFRFDINKNWCGTVEEEFKVGDNAEKLYYQHTDFGLVTHLAEWIDLGFNFRQASEKNGDDDWIWENRPHANLTFKWTLADLGVSDRSRLEFRDKYNAEDIWRYRNKLTVKFPWELTSLKLKPYVAEEIYINLNQSGINKNRLYSGFSVNPAKNLSANVYYLWEASKSDPGWNDIHVLGTQLQLKF
jgi:hypothetical protein